MIKASQLTETDSESIPTGNLKSVEGTLYDLRTMKNLGVQIEKLLPAINGYDDNYCIDNNTDGTTLNIIAKYVSLKFLKIKNYIQLIEN